jgi:hypothetical protein
MMFRQKYRIEFVDWLSRFANYFKVSGKSLVLAPTTSPSSGPQKIGSKKRQIIWHKLGMQYLVFLFIS